MRADPSLSHAAQGQAERRIDAAATHELELLRTAADPPGPPPARLLPVLAAMVPVHLLTVVTLIGGLALVVTGEPGLIVVGALLLVVAFVSRPRLERPAHPVVRLRAEAAPRTFRLLREISDHLGTRAPQEVWITSSTTSLSVVGLRRRRVLSLNAAIWVGLDAQARVALLAHYVSHLRHSELVVARWTHHALATLHEWWLVWGGQRGVTHVQVDSVRNAQGWLLRVAFTPARLLVSSYHRLVVRLLTPVCLRGERLADLDALSAAGRAAALSMLDASMSERTVEVALTRARMTHQNLSTSVCQALAGVPADIRAARRSAEAARSSRPDAFHPATSVRYQVLALQPSNPPAVMLSPEESGAVDHELGTWLTMALKEAADRMRYTRDGTRERTKAPPAWAYDLWG